MITKKIFVGILAVLAGISALWAQDINCAQERMQEQLFLQHPEMRKQAEENFQLSIIRAKELVEQQRASTKAAKYVIPVVFHVIHEKGDSRADISEDQIKNALALTNLNFQGKSLTVDEVVDQFKTIIADVEVEFRLATKDPAGNCTNGILRYEQTFANGGTDEDIKSGRQWPTNKYLNVYVVHKMAINASGYAYYPANNNEARDGIIILHNYTGSIGTSNYRNSFTLAHEAGHYLNLRHVWGNSDNADLASNCQVDDGIEDTPLTRGSTSCDLGRQTCGSLDNVQNFMDYSFCCLMFTEGQKAFMHAALESSVAGRNNLWKQFNLEETGVLYDQETGPDFLCKSDFSIVGESVICPGSSVTFKDASFFGVEGWEWSFPGGSPATSIEQNPVVIYNSPGEYDVTLKVTKGTDEVSATRQSMVRVLDNQALNLPYQEEFIDPSVLEPGGTFIINNSDGGYTWELTELAGYEDETSCYINAREVTSSTSVDDLISIPFVLTGMTNPFLSFVYAQAQRAFTNGDELKVSVSTDCGENYTVLKSLIRNSLATSGVNASGSFVPADKSEWKSLNVDLTNYQNQEIQIKISYKHGGGNNVFIDKINIADGTTSVGSLDGPNSLEIYPNPNNGHFNIKFAAPESLSKVSILNTVGEIIMESDVLVERMEFKANHKLQSGVYFVVVEDLNGLNTIKKITIIK